MSQFIIECTRASGAKEALNYLQKCDEDLTFTVIPDSDHSWRGELKLDWFHHFFIDSILNKRSIENMLAYRLRTINNPRSRSWSYNVVQIKI